MGRHAWLVACVLVAACGGGDDGGPIPIGGLQAAYTGYECNLIVRCGLVDDLATCRELRLDLNVDPNLIAAVEAGTVTYDGAAAAACLAQITSGCDRSNVLGQRNSPESCDQIFTGTVPDQGTCALDQECISNVCMPGTCSMACCPGTCVGGTAPVRPVVGEACGNGPQCVDSFCDSTTLLCTAFLAAGATCDASSQCAVGLGCITSTCTALAQTGGACTQTSACRSVGDYCSPAMACAPLGLTGDACTNDADCSSVYLCDLAAHTCKLRPTLGDTCSPQANLDCVDKSFCDATSTCVAPAPDGTTCTSDYECTSNYCDFTTATGTCMTPAVCI